jgi:hypothetical protein
VTVLFVRALMVLALIALAVDLVRWLAFTGRLGALDLVSYGLMSTMAVVIYVGVGATEVNPEARP